MAPPPPPPPAAYGAGQEAPSAQKALIAGLVGVLCCAIGGIFAIIWGNAANKEIAASGGMLGGEGKAKVAVILGWIAIALWVLAIVLSLTTGAFNFTVTST